MNLRDIARVLNLPCTRDGAFSGLTIDSRKIQPGDVFVALRGDRFDGHDYIADAARAGAAVVICQHVAPDVVGPEQWVVASSLQALASIATWYRQQFTCPMIAVTGSDGKTSVKEMIARIRRTHKE